MDSLDISHWPCDLVMQSPLIPTYDQCPLELCVCVSVYSVRAAVQKGVNTRVQFTLVTKS